MTQIKNSILLLTIIAIISFMASYVISINIEQKFIALNSKWISNEFILACFAGLFASTLILIATEIQKYVREKRIVEHFTFNQIVMIYGELRSIRKTILDIILSEKYEEVTLNLLSHTSNILRNITENLRLTDYNTILHCKNNRRNKIIKKISTLVVNKIQNIISVFGYLPSAILTDKIESKEESTKTGIKSNERKQTKRTLSIILKEIDTISNELYDDIVELNSACNNRFKWSEIDSKISNPPDLDTSLEGFYNTYEMLKQCPIN